MHSEYSNLNLTKTLLASISPSFRWETERK